MRTGLALSLFGFMCAALGTAARGTVAPPQIVVLSARAGGFPTFTAFNTRTGEIIATGTGTDAAFRGGVRVAAGDVNADGYPDVVAVTGAGGPTNVRILSGSSGFTTQIANDFQPFPPSYTGGAHVAVGDINADGYADVLVGPSTGGVGNSALIYSGTEIAHGVNLSGSNAVAGIVTGTGSSFTQGYRLALGDMDKDGHSEILVGAGKEKESLCYELFDGEYEYPLLWGSYPGFGDGLNVAMGELDSFAGADYALSMGPGGFGGVAIFSNKPGSDSYPALLKNFQPYPGYYGGAVVSIGDLNGDGKGEVVIGRQSGSSKTIVLSGSDFRKLTAGTTYSAGTQTIRGRLAVAFADFNGDGFPDAVQGDDSTPRVKIYDGKTGKKLRTYYPFLTTTATGVMVATGDVDGDGQADVVCGMKQGGSAVTVFSGSSGAVQLAFDAFASSYKGGVRVAAGDVDGDGKADLIVGQASGGSNVRVLSGTDGHLLANFIAYDPIFTGGVNVAAGDTTGDGKVEIVTAGLSGTSVVRVYSGTSGALLHSFQAFPSTYSGPVSISLADLTADGRAEIVAAANTGDLHVPHVRVFDANTTGQLGGFVAYKESLTSKIWVYAGNVNNNPAPEIVVFPDNGASGRVFDGGINDVRLAGILGWFQFRKEFSKWESMAISHR